jgi:hypothetical protein
MTYGLLDQVSFIVNSIDSEQFAQFQENLRKTFAPEEPTIIRVPDARSMAEGLNRGARSTSSEWLVFCHDDIRIIGDPKAALAEAMTTTDMFGPCGTVRLTSGNWYDAGKPYLFGHVVARNLREEGKFELQIFGTSRSSIVLGGKALDGIWIACRRSLFDALGGFDEVTYTAFVGYDIDFSFRAALAGARIGIVTGLTLFHDSHVGEFSKEKVALWERAQRNFVLTFSQHLSSEAGNRTHVNVTLSSLDEAIGVLHSGAVQPQPKEASKAGPNRPPVAAHGLARRLLGCSLRLLKRVLA